MSLLHDSVFRWSVLNGGGPVDSADCMEALIKERLAMFESGVGETFERLRAWRPLDGLDEGLRAAVKTLLTKLEDPATLAPDVHVAGVHGWATLKMSAKHWHEVALPSLPKPPQGRRPSIAGIALQRSPVVAQAKHRRRPGPMHLSILDISTERRPSLTPLSCHSPRPPLTPISPSAPMSARSSRPASSAMSVIEEPCPTPGSWRRGPTHRDLVQEVLGVFRGLFLERLCNALGDERLAAQSADLVTWICKRPSLVELRRYCESVQLSPLFARALHGSTSTSTTLALMKVLLVLPGVTQGCDVQASTEVLDVITNKLNTWLHRTSSPLEACQLLEGVQQLLETVLESDECRATAIRLGLVPALEEIVSERFQKEPQVWPRAMTMLMDCIELLPLPDYIHRGMRLTKGARRASGMDSGLPSVLMVRMQQLKRNPGERPTSAPEAASSRRLSKRERQKKISLSSPPGLRHSQVPPL